MAKLWYSGFWVGVAGRIYTALGHGRCRIGVVAGRRLLCVRNFDHINDQSDSMQSDAVRIICNPRSLTQMCSLIKFSRRLGGRRVWFFTFITKTNKSIKVKYSPWPFSRWEVLMVSRSVDILHQQNFWIFEPPSPLRPQTSASLRNSIY